jgi:hypothetical protein
VVDGRYINFSLKIKASINSSAGKNGNSIVFIDVILKNTGRTKINAKPKKFSQGKPEPLYQDDFETLYHSCELQIRRLDAKIDGNAVYDWYGLSNVTEEINLIDDYEINENGAIEFWLEPGDTVHLGTALTLHPDHYLAKVTFLGSSKAEDYWERYFYFQVPVQKDTKEKGTSEGII